MLALHPYDPDAMGLHITLFGVEALDADGVEQDYGLGPGALDAYRDLAREYKELGGQLVRFADKIAYHVPVALVMPGLRGDVH